MAHKMKKKTVKELNEDFILMENKLEKFEKMVNNLTAKIEALEKHKKDSPNVSKSGPESENVDENKYACKKCDCIFGRKDELKLHLKEKHKPEIKCNMCGEMFNLLFELENHLKKHDEVETLKCNICEKIFYMKWRLKKHEEAHKLSNVKFCHYFNNNKVCPFEEIGCMFKHAFSEECKFKKQCRNNLCQFRHSSININCESDSNTGEEQIDVVNYGTDDHLDLEYETEEEEEDLECDECGKVSDNFDDYIEHRGRGDCVFWCNHCDKFFRQEVDLKKHVEKHCTKCCKQFTTKNAVKEHNCNCNSIL